MVDIPELSTWTMQNGKTFRFMDAVARQQLKKKYGADNPPPYPVTSVNGQTGDVVVAAASRNIWYATCSTATGTAAKTATSATGDFVLATGNMVRVKFANTNNQTQPTLSVDGSTAKRIKNLPSENNINTQWWRAGEVIDLVYDGTDFIISDGGTASTSYYGKTILTNSTSSTSQSKAATAKAVKAAYDLADSKVDAAGAAAAAPVQSVNGATGAVVLGKSEVGLGNVDNVQQYSASNPPPYPVTSVNGSTGAVEITAAGLGVPNPYNMTALYIGSITTPIANDTVLTLDDDVTNYKLLLIHAYNGSPAPSTRMIIFDCPMVTSAHGIVGAGGNGIMGSLYIRQDGTTTYTFLGSSFSTLYIQVIYGIK